MAASTRRVPHWPSNRSHSCDACTHPCGGHRARLPGLAAVKGLQQRLAAAQQEACSAGWQRGQRRASAAGQVLLWGAAAGRGWRIAGLGGSNMQSYMA
jgi:hypothetical protein